MTTENTEATDERQIHTLIDNWANALRAKNADGVVSQYAPDSVGFILAPPLQYTQDHPFGKQATEEWFSPPSKACSATRFTT
jgi:ketosteroid isomerase-like protein